MDFWTPPRFLILGRILVSVKFVSAILGPEMGAPILWTPGKMRSFCRKNHVRKIPLFWGGFGGGGGSADFIFMGARIFLMILVAHPCGDPNRATQCRAQSVASNSRRIRDVAPKSRYTPPNQGVAPFSGPPCRTFLSFAAGRGGAAGWWRVSRHFWVPKTDRATGGCRSYSHTSRATLCN